MKTKVFYLIALFITLTGNVFGQSMSLSPAVLSPNIISITAVNAGALPADPLVNNTSQSLVYKFRRTYGWGSQELGHIDVNCWYIPNGFAITTQADNNAGSAQKYGVSNGSITVNSNYQYLIYNIQTTQQVTRVLTMSVVVTNFSQLAIGEYDVSVNYRLSY